MKVCIREQNRVPYLNKPFLLLYYRAATVSPVSMACSSQWQQLLFKQTLTNFVQKPATEVLWGGREGVSKTVAFWGGAWHWRRKRS